MHSYPLELDVTTGVSASRAPPALNSFPGSEKLACLEW